MKANVTCEVCGAQHMVARVIDAPEVFYLVCHNCEATLQVEVTLADLRTSIAAAALARQRRARSAR